MRWKLLVSLLVVCMLVNVSLATVAVISGKGEGGKPKPPADPAIAFYQRGGSAPNKPAKLMVMNDDGSNLAAVYEDHFDVWGGVSWSPDGNSIAWAGHTYIPNVPGYVDQGVWRIDVSVVEGEPQGSNLQQLVDEEYCESYCTYAAWSPLGNEIAVVERSPGLTDTIFVVPATGGSPQVIYTAPEGTAMVTTPTWSSDGTQIAFREVEISTGDYYINIMDRDTGTVTHTLLKGQFYIGVVDWARQGQDILAFHGGSGTTDKIYTIDIETETVVEVVEGTMPSWSPDNSKLAFMTLGRAYSIATYDFDTGKVSKLTRADHAPDWSRA